MKSPDGRTGGRVAAAPVRPGYLLLSLRLLHHLSAHFDPRGEDGAGEVGHADALQVTHLLGR